MLVRKMVKDSDFYRRISKIGLKKRWNKEHSKVRINNKLSKEKIAINAYLCGDGYIKVRKDRNSVIHHEIGIFPDDLDLAKRIVRLFQKEFKIKPKIRKDGGCFRIRVANKPACLHLLSLGKYKSKNWSIPKDLDKSLLKEWIKCFFDCEAYVNTSSKIIQVKSINHKGLKSIKEMLKVLGIDSRLYGPYKPKLERHSSYSMINIPQEELTKYKKLIKFYHKEKVKKLNSILNMPGSHNGSAHIIFPKKN